jgi:ABC-type glycerol-3-phosphate transport system substrate-binding protein
MTKNKVLIVRDHILSMLESGRIRSGDRIPGARDIAEQLNISFLKVQQAVESLCQDGVLHSRSRAGTFVQAGWDTRVLEENVCVYNPVDQFPWIGGLLELIEGSMPGLRSSFGFKQGILELRTTSHVLTEYNDYMDLSEVFQECFPDRSDFFAKPFLPFEIEGKMVGIPFAFSPRVIFYNPSLFEQAGCPLPRAGWTWADFASSVECLKRILPNDRIINYHARSHLFMNFIARSGGRLFDPSAEDPVTVDSPEVVEGLRLFRELGNMLPGVMHHDAEFVQSFLSGEAAMQLTGRHFMDFILKSNCEGWSTAPLPLFEGGVDSSAQATDLICVRKSCASPELAKRYVSAMLSEQVQDYIGQSKHNIPIRKSSAFKSLDLDDSRDALFATELAKISNSFNLQPPYPGSLVLAGIARILDDGIDIEEGLSELGQVARTILGIRGQGKVHSKMRTVFGGMPR